MLRRGKLKVGGENCTEEKELNITTSSRNYKLQSRE
jgi:hypothetical protein